MYIFKNLSTHQTLSICQCENHRVSAVRLVPSVEHPLHLRENSDVEKTDLNSQLLPNDNKPKANYNKACKRKISTITKQQ